MSQVIQVNQVSQVRVRPVSPSPPQPPYRPQGGLIGILEVGGVVQPGNRFVSFVRASGRGEAKLRGRSRADVVCVPRAPTGQKLPPPARSWLLAGLFRELLFPARRS